MVLARIGTVDEARERLTVADRAAWIGEEHHIAGRRVEMVRDREHRSVIDVRPAVDVERERILARRIEARRIEDPAVHPLTARTRAHPDLLQTTDVTGRAPGRVEIPEDPLAAPLVHREGCRPVRFHARVREDTARSGIRPAARTRQQEPRVADLGDAGLRLRDTVRIDEADAVDALVLIQEVQPSAILAPARLLGVAVERQREIASGRRAHTAIRSDQRHHEDVVALVGVAARVPTDISDLPTVGAHRRALLGAIVTRQLPRRSAFGDRPQPKIRLVSAASGRRIGVTRHDDRRTVGQPSRRLIPCAPVPAATGDLPRRTALDTDDEHMGLARRQVARRIGAVRIIAHDARRRRPLRGSGLLRQRIERFRLLLEKRDIGKRTRIRRPRE